MVTYVDAVAPGIGTPSRSHSYASGNGPFSKSAPTQDSVRPAAGSPWITGGFDGSGASTCRSAASGATTETLRSAVPTFPAASSASTRSVTLLPMSEAFGW